MYNTTSQHSHYTNYPLPRLQQICHRQVQEVHRQEETRPPHIALKT